MPEKETSSKDLNTRSVLSTQDEVRQAVVKVAALAQRTMSIFTQDLEPGIYDQPQFLEVAKRLVLAKSFARVRVLVADPMRAVREGHALVILGRRLTSFIEIRNVHKDYRDRDEAYLIADDRALVYRLEAKRWEGMADTDEQTVAKAYLNQFDEIWHASAIEPEIRHLHV
ncbi:MAG: hypothetical protein V3T51_05220 [Gammaproteobacteria bacterium]